MTSLAVTGHMDLTKNSVPLIRAGLDELLKPYACAGLTGVSCMARGADSIFAESVLAAGGRLVVVVPSQDYRRTTVPDDHAETFDRLLAAAAELRVMPAPTANLKAYEAANTMLLKLAERLVAVWDGRVGEGGGTADVVDQAQASNIPIDIVWPAGAARLTPTPPASPSSRTVKEW
ncbi:hypothetical protein [Actinomadura decatromicini]|uniref:DNA recombination-mediator protein A n=1 Tax=Actinomadura decatromicini TaxID=2604572 RepID=A0A5D3F766_9ACTN|nr:hypothetical protein [Actinomadura decatromicini]TYK43656.1 hypothetical protein FXF68_36500 [Actinomadura decatromicini]